MVYKAEVLVPGETSKVYFGSTGRQFKTRHYDYKTSFKYESYWSKTKLAEHIWSLKDKGCNNYSIKWSIHSHAKPYVPGSRHCDLCLSEKLIIINYNGKSQLLNKRNEIISKCRHQNKYLLSNYKPIT